jgi:hypothetical protein
VDYKQTKLSRSLTEEYATTAVLGLSCEDIYLYYRFDSQYNPAVLVVYEYVITFDQEVSTIWKRRFIATSILLLSTRWVLVLYQIVPFMPSPKVCGIEASHGQIYLISFYLTRRISFLYCELAQVKSIKTVANQ